MSFEFIKDKGVREAVGAISAAIVVGAIIATVLFLFSGCASQLQVNAEYEHHSSIPDARDLNTTDQVGICLDQKLGKQRYAPSIEGCVSKEVGGPPVFGRDPVGTLRIKQPLFKGSNR